MIRPQRAVHRWTWPVLALVLAALAVVALSNRAPKPKTPDALPGVTPKAGTP